MILLSLSTNKKSSQIVLNAQLISLMLLSHKHCKQNRSLVINKDYTKGALAVTAGKDLAKKLVNAQERRHLELKKSSNFPENIPKLYLVNHIIKVFID